MEFPSRGELGQGLERPGVAGSAPGCGGDKLDELWSHLSTGLGAGSRRNPTRNLWHYPGHTQGPEWGQEPQMPPSSPQSFHPFPDPGGTSGRVLVACLGCVWCLSLWKNGITGSFPAGDGTPGFMDVAFPPSLQYQSRLGCALWRKPRGEGIPSQKSGQTHHQVEGMNLIPWEKGMGS